MIYGVFLVSNKSVDKTAEDVFNAIQLDYAYHLELLVPGETKICMCSPGNGMGGEHPVSTIIFRDMNQKYWVRNHSGQLIKIDKTFLSQASKKKGWTLPGYPSDIACKK